MRLTNLTTKEVIQYLDNLRYPTHEQLVYLDHLRNAVDEIEDLTVDIERLVALKAAVPI
jgi:hypothetical protein